MAFAVPARRPKPDDRHPDRWRKRSIPLSYMRPHGGIRARISSDLNWQSRAEPPFGPRPPLSRATQPYRAVRPRALREIFRRRASASAPEPCPSGWSVLKTAALPLSYLDIARSTIAITGMSPNTKARSTPTMKSGSC